jgi:hypothetical protein
MKQSNSLSSTWSVWQPLTGVVFAALFLAQSVVGDALATIPLPLPGAPAAEVARYFTASQTAAVAGAVAQIVTAVSLLVFAGYAVNIVRLTWSDGGALPGLTLAGGLLASAFLLASALFGLALVPVAAGGNLPLVDILRNLNFLSGGTLHVASLGVFVGAASIAALRANALPVWIVWLGIVTAAVAILSLASLVVFPATLLILVGRWLTFVWSIAVGIVLAFGKPNGTIAEGDRIVLAQ